MLNYVKGEKARNYISDLGHCQSIKLQTSSNVHTCHGCLHELQRSPTQENLTISASQSRHIFFQVARVVCLMKVHNSVHWLDYGAERRTTRRVGLQVKRVV